MNLRRSCARSALFALTLACVSQPILSTPTSAEDAPRIQVRRTPDRVRFGLIGETRKGPAPTLFLFASGIEEMERQPVYTQVARILAGHGWVSIVLDPPCHGEDVRLGEPAGLGGWCHRLEQGEDFVPAFTAKARAVLDVLARDGVADPGRVAACGTSRGGFLAFHLAASEPRIKAVAGISPVTRLGALREFATPGQRAKGEPLDAVRLAPRLADRALWLSIGNNDVRVNTDDAIAFTRAVVRAAVRPESPNDVIPVELVVAPTPGHSKIEQAHELLAAWLLRRFPPTKEGNAP
jgi:dienelactone hydrolase